MFSDVVLYERAIDTRKIFSTIDNSWKKRLREVEKKNVEFPFNPKTTKFQCEIVADRIVVFGMKGDLVINKVVWNKDLFLMDVPVKVKNFLLVGIFDLKGKLLHFGTRNKLGFHIMGIGSTGYRSICVGEFKRKFKSGDNFDVFMEDIKRVFKLLSFIYPGSLANYDVQKTHWLYKYRGSNGQFSGSNFKKMIEDGHLKSALGKKFSSDDVDVPF